MDRPPSLPLPHNPFSYQPPPLNPSPIIFVQPHPNSSQYSAAPTPPVCDLSDTLASLNSLVSLCERTVDSLAQTLNLESFSRLLKDENGGFVRCPYNQNHRMPPEALFLHSLRCPPSLDFTPLLFSLSNYQTTPVPRCKLPLKHSGGDLCLCLDDFADFASSFFYKDCPGVVNISELDKRNITLTLPSVLSVECCDFECFEEMDTKDLLEIRSGILPSDLWAIRNEIDTWRDYPSSYSLNVLCAILGSNKRGKSDLRKWVLANSPRYGVIIDKYMADHIYLLMQLCFKAIVKEAHGSADFDANIKDMKGNDQTVSLKRRIYECPLLAQVLTWLSSELAVLYGDRNARFFVLDMFRQWIVESSSQITLFSSQDDTNSHSKDLKLEKQAEDSSFKEQVISVSHVAAAVVALHKRSLLEGQIRAIRFTQPQTRYQRMAEHDAMSAKADAERDKRPTYRPIIEHDGLPRQRLSNHEANKMKTKEELMAEERDYRRRRMSYRGKKVKRTPLQVLRDMIEEYTEEIKLAGGIGCSEKKNPSSSNNGDKKNAEFDHKAVSAMPEASPTYYKQARRDYRADNECAMDDRVDADMGKWYKEDYDSRSLRRQRSDHTDEGFKRQKHCRIQMESHHQNRRSASHAKSSLDYKRRRDDLSGRSRSRTQNEFEDRYNPSSKENERL